MVEINPSYSIGIISFFLGNPDKHFMAIVSLSFEEKLQVEF